MYMCELVVATEDMRTALIAIRHTCLALALIFHFAIASLQPVG